MIVFPRDFPRDFPRVFPLVFPLVFFQTGMLLKQAEHNSQLCVAPLRNHAVCFYIYELKKRGKIKVGKKKKKKKEEEEEEEETRLYQWYAKKKKKKGNIKNW
ncbi:hypothetical protein POVWA2_003460 [Plasmodium ovale wallikeri]|uniref:Uncharacterized protein n=1 Tax=Plasmodium ovale wallikeri TaxID=864142 RepID=A0A1A8YID7_PLAOA|nr:hypothetical protein POVWA2_003460 [Plasmodium ovale wallikeri]